MTGRYQGEGGIPDIRSRIYIERGSATLDANGDATITFQYPVPASESFFLHLTPWIQPGENQVIANPAEWVVSGDEITGVRIEAGRLRPLPSTILVLSALFGFRVWLRSGSQGASGVRVDWMLY